MMKIDLNCCTIKIWKNLIEKLEMKFVLNCNEKNPEKFMNIHDDLNVEHAQLCLYLFHNMELLQRKEILSLIVHSIDNIGKYLKKLENIPNITNNGLIYLNRILHLFEYIIKNLYEIPKYLSEQISHNIMIREDFKKGQYLLKTMKDYKNLSDLRSIQFFNDDHLKI